jgi:hypothetical protein
MQHLCRSRPRLDWRTTAKDGYIRAYTARVDAIIQPYLGNTYNSISSLDEEIRLVSAAVLQAASSTIPPHKSKKRAKTSSLVILN